MLSIPTGELVGTIADVLPFASQDKELPAINAVRVEWDGDRLHAFATDRFVAAWSRWHPGDDPTADHKEGAQDGLFDDWGSADKPWSFVIPQPDAAEIVKIFKLPTKVDRHPLEVDVDYPKVTIRRRPGSDFSAITFQFEAPLGSAFPEVRNLLGRTGVSELLGECVSWDPKKLATFAKVRYHGVPRFYLDGPHRLTLVEIGERFTGAIMPIRVNDDDEPKPEPVEQVDGQSAIGDDA